MSDDQKYIAGVDPYNDGALPNIGIIYIAGDVDDYYKSLWMNPPGDYKIVDHATLAKGTGYFVPVAMYRHYNRWGMLRDEAFGEYDRKLAEKQLAAFDEALPKINEEYSKMPIVTGKEIENKN